MNWKKMIRKILVDQTGATAIEYGLVVCLIAIAIIVSLGSVADRTISMWDRVSGVVIEAVQK